MRWPASLCIRRFSGAAAALAWHVVIVLAFLSATRWSQHGVEQNRDVILRLVTWQPSKPQASPKHQRRSAAPRAIPNYALPADVIAPQTMNARQTNGLDHPFFDCSPEQMVTATAQERAACAAASLTPRTDSGEADYRDHTDRSKSAALWARDRARRNAPLLLPCMNPNGFSPVYTAYCLGKAAAQGKIDPEDQPGYQDQPDHVANDGDTRMAPAPH